MIALASSVIIGNNDLKRLITDRELVDIISEQTDILLYNVKTMKNGLSAVFYSNCFIHISASASEGILQSPRGESETLPTLGPSGMHERLNCDAKNLL